MGDPACWLAEVCADCGRVADVIDADERCEACAEEATTTSRRS